MKEECEREACSRMDVHTLKTHGARRNIGGINSGSGGVLWLCIEIPELASICSRGERREREGRERGERGDRGERGETGEREGREGREGGRKKRR